MFYPVSKTIALILDPGNVLLMSALAGLLLYLFGFRRPVLSS